MVIDAKTVFRNLAAAGRLCRSSTSWTFGRTPRRTNRGSWPRCKWRPARSGLTVAKVGEAEIMAEVADDILVAYPAIDPARTARLARLAAHATLRVAVDSIAGAKLLGEAANRATATVGILVDLDVGMGRTGLQTASRDAQAGPVRRRHARPAAGRAVLLSGPHRRSSRPNKATRLHAVSDKLDETLACGTITGCKPASSPAGRPPRPSSRTWCPSTPRFGPARTSTTT